MSLFRKSVLWRFVPAVLTFGILLGAASSADAHQLELISLQCIGTQERDSNGDELQISVNSFKIRRNGVRAGSVWRINRRVFFANSARITLKEIDGFGINFRDETLGSLFQRPNGSAIKKYRFNRHGSHYLLTYRVILERSFKVRFISLECITPQERDSNGDELRIRFRSDDVLGNADFRQNNLRSGVTRDLRRLTSGVKFVKQARINLTEIDTLRDENLGTVIVRGGPGTRSVVFQRHGASYRLRYEIILD